MVGMKFQIKAESYEPGSLFHTGKDVTLEAQASTVPLVFLKCIFKAFYCFLIAKTVYKTVFSLRSGHLRIQILKLLLIS